MGTPGLATLLHNVFLKCEGENDTLTGLIITFLSTFMEGGDT